MNSNKHHNTNRSHLSREDIERYKSTHDESIKHSIEKNAIENDFDADALEGWTASTETPLTLKRLDKKFIGKSSNYYWIGGTIGLLIIGFSIVLFTQKDEKADAVQKQTSSTSIKVEQTDVLLPEKIEAMVELPKKEQIAVQTIISDFTEQKTEQTTKEIPVEVDRLPITKIEEPKKEPTLVKETLFGKEIYLFDLKLLDYRAYRSRPKIITKQMILTGTPANIGETSESVETTEWKDVEIPYIDYLSKTMELFSKGNNKKALSRFQVILETYSDDINANFYAGLCYYNLKEYLKAVKSFEICVDSKYTNFAEEAEWYMAKSLLAGGDKSRAIAIFQKIAGNNSYYSSQAKKIISTL